MTKGTKGDRYVAKNEDRVLPNRKADIVTEACVGMLDGENTLSLTADNGKEFTHHQKMATELNTTIYFAKLYHSWERDTNDCALG